jgi:hypothetical protein
MRNTIGKEMSGRLLVQILAIACFVFQPIRLHAIDNTTTQDVRWSVWHEGCRIFGPAHGDDPFSDGMNSIASLRQCIVTKQAHNQGAQDRIANLNDGQLTEILRAAERDIPNQFSLEANFIWVCHHEGQLNQFRIWAAQGNYESIRSRYHEKQEHNPNAKNLLSAVTNRDIKTMLDAIH